MAMNISYRGTPDGTPLGQALVILAKVEKLTKDKKLAYLGH